MEPESPQTEVPEVPKKRGRRPRKVAVPAQSSLTMEDVLRLMAEQSEANQKTMVAAIIEARRPSDLEQRKLDKEREQELARAKARVAAAKAEEEMKRNVALNCTHTRYNPATKVSSHLWVAKVYSPNGEDPYFIPMCQNCHTLLPKIKANPSMSLEGVNLNNYTSIDMEDLLKWAVAMGNEAEVVEFKRKLA